MSDQRLSSETSLGDYLPVIVSGGYFQSFVTVLVNTSQGKVRDSSVTGLQQEITRISHIDVCALQDKALGKHLLAFTA